MRLGGAEAAIGEVVNIGNTGEITIEKLAELVKQRTKSDSPITFVPYDQAYEPGFEDMPRRVPALGKLERLTGFRPTTPLVEIVERVIAHFREKKEPVVSKSADGSAYLNLENVAIKRVAT